MVIDYSSLIQMAFEARENSQCKYSGFAVGAALLCDNGEVFTGCNIECSAFSATTCAERVAVFKAVSEGITDFVAIAVVGGGVEDEELDFCSPCGVCRQVLAEYCGDADFEIVLAKNTEEFAVYKMHELLPLAFTDAML